MDADVQPRILFVDDERNILSGLKRSLRPMRHKWNLLFVPNGMDALKLAQNDHCHILVTDLCMPEMNGVDLLRRFKKIHPDTIRIVLSGQTDRDAFWEAIGIAHLYMGKPCDSRDLEAIISHALSAQSHLSNTNWRRIVSQTEFVPFFPVNWRALRRETLNKQCDMEAIAEIIQQDPGMSVKTLQIANSAYFGTSHFFSSAQKAAISLSSEGIHALASYYQSLLDSDIFYLPDKLFGLIRQRCRLTAMIAKAIAREEKGVNETQAFMAGLLRALGEIIFLNHQPDEYRRALDLAAREKRTLWDTEREILKCSHADLNLFLVSLWGLPKETCQALAPPRRPRPNQAPFLNVQTISYVAEILTQQIVIFQDQEPKLHLYGDDLNQEGLAAYLPKWWEIGQGIFKGMDEKP